MDFTNKVVLVTGAASGIGRATAERFAKAGAVLALADINMEGLADTVALLGNGVTSSLHEADVSDAGRCSTLVEEVVARHGKLDVLANVAGMLDWSPLGTYTPDRWNRIMAVNAASVFFLSQAAVPHLKSSQGNIVNVASAAGLVGIAYNSAYCASKAAVIAMTKAMAIELAADQVRVNAVCPSGVSTPMIMEAGLPEGAEMSLIARSAPKMGRFIEADEVAASILYLASHDARSVTGAALPIDSAQTAG
ncbi:short-chain dehydrogenase [Brevundimonas sp. GN22]